MPSKSGGGQICDGCAGAGLPALKAAAEGHAKCLSRAFAADRQRSLSCDSKGATALHLAARGGRLECITWLLAKSGIPVTVQAKNGETPLHLSAASGHIGCLQYLITYDKEAVNAVDRYNQTPLHLAVLRERFTCTKWLLEIGKADPLARTATGAIPLHFAAAQGYLNIVKILLKNMSPGDVDQRDNDGTAALFYAAQSGHASVVEEMAQCYHANALAVSSDGMTALHGAVQAGQLPVVQWLHSWLHGEHLMDKTNDGATVLHFASSMGKTSCLIWLLSQEDCVAAINTTDTGSGSTPAHDAAENGELECLQALVSHGADVTVKDNEGYTPYDLAFHGEYDECASFLKAQESRRKEAALIRQTPIRAKSHQKRIVNGHEPKAQIPHVHVGASRFKDKQLFNPTYSASSLMKALPDRMSSASSLPADVAEMASLDDLDLDGTDSDETPGSSMQNISTAHMLPALREQLEAMGVLAADLQVLDVQSGLPPSPAKSAGFASSAMATYDTRNDPHRRGVMKPAVSLEVLSNLTRLRETDDETRSLSDELFHSSISLTTERVEMWGGAEDNDSFGAETENGECDVPGRQQEPSSPSSEQKDKSTGGAQTRSTRSNKRPFDLQMETHQEDNTEDQTPTASPTGPLGRQMKTEGQDLPRPSSSTSDNLPVERCDLTPRSTPRVSRHPSGVSNRLKFIAGMTPATPAADESVKFELDEDGIPIPPPAPTPQSLMAGVVSLQTVAADKVPKWMRRYRRGWLARAIGDKVQPEEELMVVLGLRKRQIDGFENLIAKKAAQLSNGTSRPTTPTHPRSPVRPETPPLDVSII